MVTCYPKEYCDTHDIIDKSYFTGNEYDAKKERDTLARSLRKEGYTVETKKYRFDTKDAYTIHATREKTKFSDMSDDDIKDILVQNGMFRNRESNGLPISGSNADFIYDDDEITEYSKEIGIIPLPAVVVKND